MQSDAATRVASDPSAAADASPSRASRPEATGSFPMPAAARSDALPTRSRPVRLVLANDSDLVVAGLRTMLASFDDRVTVVGELVGDPDLGQDGADDDVDIVLLDAFAREAGGLDAAAILLARRPDSKVVVFTEETDPELVVKALRLGVSGYVSKALAPDHLVETLEDVADGEIVVDQRMATRAALLAIRALDEREPWRGADLGLTRREGEVLALLGDGLSLIDVARKLSISRETVRTHVKHIYAKLDVNTRAAAVSVAWQEGVAGTRLDRGDGSTGGETDRGAARNDRGAAPNDLDPGAARDLLGERS